MHPVILAALLCTQPDVPVVRVQVDTLTRAELERLDGKTVITTVTVDKPAYTWGTGKNLRTVFGPKTVGHEDLSVVLKGNRLRDTDRDARVSFVGKVHVIRHPDSTINGRTFAGFTEIRIEEREMTPALALALALGASAQPGETVAPVKFDTISLKDAERLDGSAVTIRFTVATPAYTWGEGAKLCTIVGPADRSDGAEWTVSLKGDRLHDADDGAKLTVTGRLRVIRHPAAVVDGVRVVAWTEVRVTEE